jgi:hypothetical protein
MKSEANQKRSESMKQVWLTRKEEMLNSREIKTSESRKLWSDKIKQHFVDHPEHRLALSNAQKKKWSQYKKALAYCKQAGIVLE